MPCRCNLGLCKYDEGILRRYWNKQFEGAATISLPVYGVYVCATWKSAMAVEIPKAKMAVAAWIKYIFEEQYKISKGAWCMFST